MSWILLEIAPFIVGALVLGVIGGYLMWRRGRDVIEADEWNALQARSREASENVVRLTGQCDALTDDLSRANEAAETLRSDLGDANEMITLNQAHAEQFERAHADAEARAAKLSDQQESTLRELEVVSIELEDTRVALGERVSDLETRATISADDLDVLRGETAELQEEVERAREKLSRQQDENARLLGELASVHVEAAELRAQLVAADEQMKVELEARSESDQALSVAREEIARLHVLDKEVATLKQTLEETYQRVGELETDAKNTDEVAAERDNAFALRDQANQELEALRAEADSRVAAVQEEAAWERLALENERGAISAELEQARDQVAMLDQNRLDSEIMEGDFRQAKVDRGALRAQLAATLSTIDLMRTDMIAAHRRLAELEMASARGYESLTDDRTVAIPTIDELTASADAPLGEQDTVRPMPDVAPRSSEAHQPSVWTSETQ